jgi:hypothetical protein
LDYYLRNIYKQTNSINQFILVEDINDMILTNHTLINSGSYSNIQTQVFGDSISWTWSGVDDILNLGIDSYYLGNPTYSNSGSEFYISLQILDSNGNNLYTNPNYPKFLQFGDIFGNSQSTVNSFTFSLPVDSNGEVINQNYTINYSNLYNFDYTTGLQVILL